MKSVIRGELYADPIWSDPQLENFKAMAVAIQNAFLPRKMYAPPASVEKIIADTVLGVLETRKHTVSAGELG